MKKINNLKINRKKMDKLTKLLLPIILVTTMVGCQAKSEEKENKKNVEEQIQVEEKQSSEENNNPISVEEEDNTTSETEEKQVNESEIVNNFNELQSEFEQIDSFDSENIKQWAFDKLEYTVNFITNKEPIGNIYFKDLTGTAKGVVVGTFTYIDEKLLNLCPDYKDRAANIFNKTKEELNEFKETVEKSIGEQIGVEKYNEIKSNTKNKISEVKEKIKDGYNKTKEKIKKWYNDNTNKNT